MQTNISETTPTSQDAIPSIHIGQREKSFLEQRAEREARPAPSHAAAEARASENAANAPVNSRPKTEGFSRTAATIAVNFLRAFDPDGYHNLVALDPTKERQPKGQTFKPGDWAGIEKFVVAHYGKDNLYFTLNEPSAHAPNKKLEKTDIAKIRGVGADIDPRGGAAELAAERQRLSKLAEERAGSDLPPSFAIDTGGGVQFIWLLKEKLTAREHELDVEAQGRGIAYALGGDTTQNIDRIYRLPGTINIPDSRKLAKGRIERQSTILRESDKRFDLEAIRRIYEPVQSRDIRGGGASDEVSAAIAELDLSCVFVSYSDLPEALRAKFNGALASNDKLRVLWETGQHDKPDQSASNRRFVLAQHLRRAGGYEINEYASLLWVWEHAINPGDDQDEKLSPREIARCWVHANVPKPPTSEEFFEVLPPTPPAVSIEPVDIFGHQVPMELRNPPEGCLPALIDRWAESQARRKGTSNAFAAVCAITTIGASIGSTLKIQVRANDPEFVEPAAAWAVLLAPPGSAKSAIISAAVEPLRKLDGEWKKADAPRHAAWVQEEKRARRNGGRVGAEPQLRRAIVDDITTEAQIRIHAANPRGILRVTDELGGVVETFGAYKRSGGGDRNMALRLFDGGSVTVDRVGTGTIHAEHGLMSILAGTQPDKLRTMTADMQTDGLLQRFLFVIDENERVKPSDEAPDTRAAGAYRQLVRQLASVPVALPPVIKISPEGHALKSEFLDEVDALKHIPGASSAWKGHASKWEKISARIILIFHAIECCSSFWGEVLPEVEVDAATVKRALSFCRFLLRHSLQLYTAYFDPDPAHEEIMGLAGYLLTRPDLTVIKRRDVYQARGSLKGPDKRRDLLRVTQALEDAGWLLCHERGPDGPTAWQVNPAIHDRFSERAAFEVAERARKREAIQDAVSARRKLAEGV